MERNNVGFMFRIRPLLGLLLIIFCLAGCSVSEQTTPVSGTEDGKLYIGVSFPTTQLNYRRTMLDLLEDYAAEHTDTMEFMIRDADSSQEQQNQDLEEMINAGVDGIILIPYTMEGEMSMIQYGIEKDIPILTLDNTVTTSSQARTIGYVGADHELMGRQAGELLIASLEKRFGDKESWKVLYLTGVPNSSGAVDRDKGIRSVLEADSRIEIVAEYNGEFTLEKARSIMEDCLLVYPDLDGVICQNDLMAEGVCQALDAADRTGEIAIVGIDGMRTVVERIAAGQMDGTVIQYPSMILDAVQRMEDYLGGARTLTYNTFEETTPIDDGNAADYLADDLPW